MGFVREDIPEEYKKKYNLVIADVWQIDKARDAVFYMTGGNPRGPETSFDFVWKGQRIEIGSIWHEIGIGNDKVIEWQKTYLAIPESLKSQQKHIVLALVEAFESHGFAGYGANKVRVIFDQRLQIKEMY